MLFMYTKNPFIDLTCPDSTVTAAADLFEILMSCSSTLLFPVVFIALHLIRNFCSDSDVGDMLCEKC